MMRKAVIVMLSVATLASTVLWVRTYSPGSSAHSYWNERIIVCSLAPNWCVLIGVGDDADSAFVVYTSPGEVQLAYSWEVDRLRLRDNTEFEFGPLKFSNRVRRPTVLCGYPLRYTHGQLLKRYTSTRRSITIQFPAWFPFVLFAAYPSFVLVRGSLRRLHRRKHGLCVHCGYDLTGNVSGRCPECGTQVVMP